MSREIADLITVERSKLNKNQTEPVLPTATPPLPWQKVASDLFEYNKIQYVLVVDYRSTFIEFAELPKTQSQDIVLEMKKMLARHGVPQCIVSDNAICSTQVQNSTYSVFSMASNTLQAARNILLVMELQKELLGL